MPSTMMHVKTALNVNPNASTLFLIGNIIPDAIRGRKAKDKSHYRDVMNRSEALKKFARSIDKEDDFHKGVLLHLFLDWKWDEGPFRQFGEERKNEDWFPMYRREIDLSGSWMFHHMDMDKIWDSMLGYDESEFGRFKGIAPNEMKGYLQFLYQWFLENNIGPSSVFTPKFNEEFIGNVVEEYRVFGEKYHLV